MPAATTTGYAPVNGLHMYWESRGEGGVPLIVTHGGYGLTSMFGELLDQLAGDRRVIAIELQGHGHTADINLEFRYEHFGDDIAALIRHLGLGRADLLGYSRAPLKPCAARSSIPYSWREIRRRIHPVPAGPDRYPEVLAGMDEMSSAGFEQLRHAPMYPAYRAVAPDPEAFPALMDKTGELLRQDYDWSKEISQLPMPVLLVCGDSRQHFARARGRVLLPAWRRPARRRLGRHAAHGVPAGHPARPDPLRHLRGTELGAIVTGFLA